MRMSSVGALVLLGIILAIFLVGLRNRRAGKELIEYLRASGFAAGPCQVAQPFTYTDLSSIECYKGELRPGAPADVLLARRRGTSTVINGVPTTMMEDYMGLYLAPAVAAGLSDPWLQRWQADLDARGAKPMRVIRTPEGGILFNWRTGHEVQNLKARLGEVRQALP